MAQPPSYDRQYSFIDFQGSNPADPLPANQIEIEYNAVKTTLDAVLANLGLIQRDDGELANESVGNDQLEVSLRTGINPPTAWASGTAYDVNDTVVYTDAPRSELWLALEAHTSTSDFDTDSLTSGFWRKLADWSDLDISTSLEATGVSYDNTDIGGSVDNVQEAIDKLRGQRFDTKADVEAATIPAVVAALRTDGYTSVGDRGGAFYDRVGAEPSHNLKIQSADGAWWELVPDPMGINVRQAGAVGDDATDDSQAFIDAIDGVEDFDDGGTDKATHRVIVPPGRYYLAGTTLELKRIVHLLGSGSGMDNRPNPAKLRWDANTTGIIVHTTDTTGATTEGTPTGGANGSIIEGLELESDGGTIAGVTDGTEGHGIWLRARAEIRNVYVHDFPGNGINIVATLGGSADVEGNANGWRMEDVRSTGNHQSGVYVDGADVNAGYGALVDAASNGRWGINDSSFLGNTWIAAHLASNGLADNGENGSGESSWVDFGGNRYAAHRDASEADLVATQPGTDESVWRLHSAGSADVTWTAAQPEGTFFPGGDIATDNVNARSLFLGTYTEGNCAPPQLVRPTMAIGAHRGKAWLGNFYGFDLGSQEAVVGGPNWRFKNHETASPDRDLTLDLNPFSNCLAVLLAESDHANGVQLAHWDDTRGNWGLGTHGNNSNKTPLWLTTDLNARTYGRGSAIGAGFPAFERGIFFGIGNANTRYQSYATAEPSSGEHARGDIYWNADQSEGGIVGWACTAGGTPGTWATIRGPGYTWLSESTGGAVTSIDLTGIGTAKEVLIVFEAVDVDADDYFLVQLGDSGGIEATGYIGQSYSNSGVSTDTIGWAVRRASGDVTGVMTLHNPTGELWIQTHGTSHGSGGGSKTLSAALDRVRLQRVSAGNFQGGTLRVGYR